MVRKKRKQAQTRRKKARRFDMQIIKAAFKPVAMLSLLVLVGIAGWKGYQWLTLPTTLPIQHVELRGDLRRVDMDRLEQHVDAAVKGGFFSIDLEKVRSGLEALPWVYGASLRRIWPDRLIIEIEEQKPIAQWGEKGLLNRYGDVFEATLDQADQSLVRIQGEDGREEALISDFIEAERLLHPFGLRLVGLREDARRDQRLLLNNGIELALGRKNREERLVRFVSAYRRTLAPILARISVLDLRYANGFAVRWKKDGKAAKLTKTVNDRV
ncbi:MAG: cell division protein FtsQ [Thiothrix sp.]|nr:MAG: cell division protein FtsQ [Thiothrix sp.]